MILVDPRRGSGELLPYFKPFGLECYLADKECPFRDFALLDEGPDQLPAGDFCFWGNGPDGPLLVGFERKVLTDFVSSMRQHRLSGFQLPRLLKTFGVIHIILEGIWRIGETGVVEVPKFKKGQSSPEWESLYSGSRPVMYEEIDHHVSTLQYKRGLIFKETRDRKQTARYLVSRWRWWNNKTWDQHQSDEAIYAEYQPIVGSGGRRASFTQRTVHFAEKAISQADGLDKMAYSIAKWPEFLNEDGRPSIELMLQATVEEWAEVKVEQRRKDGVKMVRLGTERAKKIWAALRGL